MIVARKLLVKVTCSMIFNNQKKKWGTAGFMLKILKTIGIKKTNHTNCASESKK